MKLTKKQLIRLIVCTAVLALLFTGCTGVYKYGGIEELSFVVETEQDLAHLDEYPDLKQLDLSGSTLDHAVVGEWIAIHPWIEITYTIPIGDQYVSCEATELTIPEGQSSYDELMQNLEYLPQLTSLTLHNTSLTADQITAISEEYKNLHITYTVKLLEDSVDGRIESLDLSHLTAADVETAAQQLSMFAYATDAELMDPSGNSNLTPADVKLLMQARPDIRFHYSFDLFGKTVTTADTALEYMDTPIGDSGEAQLREALDIMPACSYVKLDNCGFSDEILMNLKQSYPDTVVAWRVSFGEQSLLTDIEALRISRGLTDEEVSILNHFTEVKYLHVDPGFLTDYSFVSSMPQLEAAVLSKNPIADLTPFASCSKLQWLELAECKQVEDLSALKDLPDLKYLNISATSVTDLSVLDELPLVYLMCLNSKVPTEQRSAAQTAHPDALVRFGTGYNYGYGWRYSDYNRTPSEYYKQLCSIFGY